MGRQKSFRSFIAVSIPASVQEEIGSFQNELRSLNLPLTWELPEKLHITLSFLGKIDDTQLNSLKLALLEELSMLDPFEITPKYLEYFYKKHGDSIIYLSLDPEKPLKDLAKKVRQVLLSQHFSPPLRFQPHINIARLKRLRHPNQVKEVLFKTSEQNPPPFSSFEVKSVELYQSNFSPDQNSTTFILKATIPFGKADLGE